MTTPGSLACQRRLPPCIHDLTRASDALPDKKATLAHKLITIM